MSWYKFDEGKTIGQKGSEGGEILFDEEHELGARITLENCGKYFAITCGIYGGFLHTVFLSKSESKNEYRNMKKDLENMLNSNTNMTMSEFVEKYP